jgi:hypothetical protein
MTIAARTSNAREFKKGMCARCCLHECSLIPHVGQTLANMVNFLRNILGSTCAIPLQGHYERSCFVPLHSLSFFLNVVRIDMDRYSSTTRVTYSDRDARGRLTPFLSLSCLHFLVRCQISEGPLACNSSGIAQSWTFATSTLWLEGARYHSAPEFLRRVLVGIDCVPYLVEGLRRASTQRLGLNPADRTWVRAVTKGMSVSGGYHASLSMHMH